MPGKGDYAEPWKKPWNQKGGTLSRRSSRTVRKSYCGGKAETWEWLERRKRSIVAWLEDNGAPKAGGIWSSNASAVTRKKKKEGCGREWRTPDCCGFFSFYGETSQRKIATNKWCSSKKKPASWGGRKTSKRRTGMLSNGKWNDRRVAWILIRWRMIQNDEVTWKRMTTQSAWTCIVWAWKWLPSFSRPSEIFLL